MYILVNAERMCNVANKDVEVFFRKFTAPPNLEPDVCVEHTPEALLLYRKVFQVESHRRRLETHNTPTLANIVHLSCLLQRLDKEAQASSYGGVLRSVMLIASTKVMDLAWRHLSKEGVAVPINGFRVALVDNTGLPYFL